MDTGVWVLVIALVLVMLSVVGFFFYKYYLEPHHVLEGALSHHSGHHTGASHISPHSDGSSSMAGHLINKMSKAKKHSNKAVKKIGQAKHHLNKAQAHAAHA